MHAQMACSTTPFLAILILLAFSSDRCVIGVTALLESDVVFDQNYEAAWGGDHISYVNEGVEVHLSIDKSSGAGFRSKLSMRSGFFRLKIKVPGKESTGIVTAFYLNSSTAIHDGLNFELVGEQEGVPITTLQTNVITNGFGKREQRVQLWFDATADFHDYAVLWNQHHIVFFVDNTPIRVFKNLKSAGVDYPTEQMKIVGSISDGSDWATDFEKSSVNWDLAPFTAQFQSFSIDGCVGWDCLSDKYWWNGERYRNLTPEEEAAYQNVKEKYLIYDYCTDKAKFPGKLPLECGL